MSSGSRTMSWEDRLLRLKGWLGVYVFVLPSLLLIGLFAYFPAGSAVYHSFFEWEGGPNKEFIGLGNFVRLLDDAVYWQSFVTIGILVAANVVKLIPSIVVAVMIHRVKSEGLQYWYRVLVVLPMIVPQLVTLFIWKFFYDPNLGPLNRFLDYTGLKELLVRFDELFGWGIFYLDVPIAWLSTPELIIPALIFWGFPWLGSVGVLIYLAGLQSIDKELYESSELDGAGPLRQFVSIEFPLIMTQVRLTLILLIISTLKGFGTFYLLLGENGGPDGAGMVPGLWMFNRAFFQGEFGYACALGLVLFLVILALTDVKNKYVRVDR